MRPSRPLAGAALVSALVASVAGTVLAIPSSATPSAPTTAPARWLVIELTDTGYLLRAGLQDSNLTITQVDDTLRIVDSGTKELQAYPTSCRPEMVPVGVAAVCDVPLGVDEAHPMTIGINPRLGDDYIDASSLSAAFDLVVLADAGRDVVLLGAGRDFVNGAKGNDWVSGSAGDDWIRTGPGNDVSYGDDGTDKLVGDDGNDRVYGGNGNDRMGGGNGDDRLDAGAGKDVVRCGPGVDSVRAKSLDKRTPDCESVELTDRTR